MPIVDWQAGHDLDPTRLTRVSVIPEDDPWYEPLIKEDC